MLNSHGGIYQKPGQLLAQIDQNKITYNVLDKSMSEDNILFHLLTHPSSMCMSINGDFILHGSAIEIDGKAYLFLGPSGIGKSYIAGMLMTEGSLISEDILRIRFVENKAIVYSSFPILKLSSDFFKKNILDSSRSFKIKGDRRERNAYMIDKFKYDSETEIASLFFCINNDSNQIIPVEGGEALKLIMYNSICPIPRNKDACMEKKLLSNIGKLLSLVPVYKLYKEKRWAKNIFLHFLKHA